MNVIHNQAQKLVLLTETSADWRSSPYGEILTIADAETFHALRLIWAKYVTTLRSDSPVSKRFHTAIKQVFDKHYNNNAFTATVTRSFGALAMNAGEMTAGGIAVNHMQQFWKHGVVDPEDLPVERLCNPLFVYSAIAGEDFAVHPDTSPLAVFHLAPALTNLAPESPLYQDILHNKTDVRQRVVLVAKMQFKAWCAAFQRVIQENRRTKSRGIVIRFVIADAVPFCFALQQRGGSLNFEMFANQSKHWSGTELNLDGDAYLSNTNNTAPISFNSIDTSCLIDHVGLINLLIATVPLLEFSSSSSICTETISRKWSEETNLLLQLLSGEVTLMCNLLGIAPLALLLGYTTRGLVQDMPTIRERQAPILSRIIWKFPQLGDPSADMKPIKLSAEPEDLTKILHLIYFTFFENEGKLAQRTKDNNTNIGTPEYNRTSFAALIAFLKPRICVDWAMPIWSLLNSICQDLHAKAHALDLQTQLHLFGVHDDFRTDGLPSRVIDLIYPPLRGPRRHRPARRGNSSLSCIVFTVPRERLLPIYKKGVTEMKDFECVFQVRLKTASSPFSYTFSSPVAVFGTLVIGPDKGRCDVVRDEKGWHGSSDLQVFLYLDTMFLTLDGDGMSISLNLFPDTATLAIFRKDYGNDLEIFKAKLDRHETQAHLVRMIGDKSIPSPSITPSPIERQERNGRVIKSIPRLGVKDSKALLAVRLNLLNNADVNLLKNGSAFSLSQSSPCAIAVKYGNAKEVVQFPFPVDGDSSTLRISGKYGWIEVCAPVSVAPRDRGGYSSNPFPVVPASGTNSIYSWNLPSINFNRLPRLEGFTNPESHSWLSGLLDGMFSDRERETGVTKSTNIYTQFKSTLTRMIHGLSASIGQQKPTAVGIRYQHELHIVFLVTGLYLDLSAHTVVVEAYNLLTSAIRSMEDTKEEMLFFDVSSLDELKLWKASLPAMIERCRTWEHNESCEYKGDIGRIGLTPFKSGHFFCSCGVGKVEPGFMKMEDWSKWGREAVRCALSPVFPAPWVEHTRAHSLTKLGSLIDKMDLECPEESKKNLTCHLCGAHGNLKKCGRCGMVLYCGKECQTKDWNRHKKSCRR